MNKTKHRKISSNQWNFILDSIFIFCLIWLASTGLLIHVKLPPGSRGITLWSISRHEWGEIHLIIGLIFLGMIFLHLILHWRWLYSMIKGKSEQQDNSKRRISIALIIIVFLCIVAISPFLSSPKSSNANEGSGGRGWQNKYRH